MNNEKEILLDPEEIQQLLEGGLSWEDIELKVIMGNSNAGANSDIEVVAEQKAYPGSLCDINTNKVAEIDDGSASESVNKIADETENESMNEIAAEEERFEQKPDNMTDETIIFNRAVEANKEIHEAYDETEVSFEEKNRFSDYLYHNSEDEFDDEDDEDDEDEDEVDGKPFMRGWRLVILMAVVAIATFGFWYYFLN